MTLGVTGIQHGVHLLQERVHMCAAMFLGCCNLVTGDDASTRFTELSALLTVHA